MKKFIQLILLVVIGVFFASPAFAIRIGLLENVKETTTAVSAAGSIYDADTGKELMVLTPMTAYRLKSGRNSIVIKLKGKDYTLNTQNVVIKTDSTGGFVMAKNRWYRQHLRISNKRGGLTVVNEIHLELYLLGVVPSEMPSSWNIEAHKAQAIAARSYAIANMGKRSTRGYDLKDTPEDQAYGGASSETQKTNSAVMATKGQVLVNNNKVISAYYHASAGGQTTTSGQVWCKNLPYLHSVPSFDDNIPRHGHGVGMSQHGANYLANHGYNAYQILAYFYTNVKLANISNSY